MYELFSQTNSGDTYVVRPSLSENASFHEPSYRARLVS